ncbi:prepilin-type N-terminal cleavage/methylation domain-containing protein [Poriferisphaera sp. WC338]|uniref:prepilin-type N-terminal cleavage/methylation domain-containing protein n=1 Tax=Poriferisphaera sp. WC338 TaxID=3425129 RepID=UPI003D819216
MNSHKTKRIAAFSLIELVIVVVIIGIIGAIAIPRMSRGASGASESAFIANLTVLRNAIDLYAAEHNGAYPTLAKFTDQLTTYSDAAGNTNPSYSSTYEFGPYLRSVPAVGVGASPKLSTVGDGSGTEVWAYDQVKGTIVANTGDAAARDGKKFKTF